MKLSKFSFNVLVFLSISLSNLVVKAMNDQKYSEDELLLSKKLIIQEFTAKFEKILDEDKKSEGQIAYRGEINLFQRSQCLNKLPSWVQF
jgi:hypothetical protein